MSSSQRDRSGKRVPMLWRRAKTVVRRHIPAHSFWLKEPRGLGPDVCYFVTLSDAGQLNEHAIVHARAWSTAGFDVVLIVVGKALLGTTPDFAAGVLIRENRGYDFGGWADAIKRTRNSVRQASTIVIVNDSNFGPFATFSNVVRRIRECDAHVVGLTNSTERSPHIQSYMLAFKGNVLTSNAFWKFWGSVKTGDRDYVIQNYELALADFFSTAGFKVAALFPTPAYDARNPTLYRWRELIDEGFPYLKVSVLRDNIAKEDLTDWANVINATGYDSSLITHHFHKNYSSTAFSALLNLTGR